MKKKAFIIAAAIALALLIGAIIYYVKQSNTVMDGVLADIPDGTPAKDVIQYGDRGENVKDLQRFLNAKLTFFYYERGTRPTYNGSTINSLVVDGIFGKQTEVVTQWWFGKKYVAISEIK